MRGTGRSLTAVSGRDCQFKFGADSSHPIRLRLNSLSSSRRTFGSDPQLTLATLKSRLLLA